VEDGAEEQVAVAMTGITLKSLSYSLNKIIENFEKRSGTDIPIPPEVTAAIERALEQGTPQPPLKR
jgi:hypothetical protein